MNSTLNKIKLWSIVLILGIGAMISAIGQVILGMVVYLEYLGITNSSVIISILIVSGITTLYVRYKTRIPSLLQWISQPRRKKITALTPQENIFIVKLVAFSGVMSGLTYVIQSYEGGFFIANLMNIENTQRKEIIGYYAALTSFITYFSFVGMNSIQNAKLISIRKNNLIDQSQFNLILNLGKTISVSTFGSLAFGAFSYFSVETLCSTLQIEIPNFIKEIILILAFVSTFLTSSLSRTVETFKYFSSAKPLNIIKLQPRQTILVIISMVIGYADILVFSLTLYIGCLVTQHAYVANLPECVIQIISIVSALSGGFLHYIFSVRKIFSRF